MAGGIYGGGASLDDLNDWLQTITGLTFDSRAYLEQIAKRSGAGGGSGAVAESRDWPQRLDDAIERFGKRVEGAVGRVASLALSQTQALARRGFSGTVEGARLDYATEQLSRQMAAVFMPIIAGMTYLASRVEREMRGMSGAQQNAMMGGVVGGIAGMRFGGVPGAMFGATVGAAYTGTGSTTTALGAAAAGAALGYRRFGPFGAVVGGAAGAAMGAPAHFGDERPSDYYSRMRAEGGSMLGAGVSTAGRSLAVLSGDIVRGLGFDSEVGRAGGAGLGAVGARGAPRRDVTPFQAQMGEAGSTFFRMQEALIRVTAGSDFEDAGPLKPIIDLLIDAVKWLAQIGSAVGASAPPSAERAR